MLLLIALLVLLAPMVVNAFQSKARVEWAPTPGQLWMLTAARSPVWKLAGTCLAEDMTTAAFNLLTVECAHILSMESHCCMPHLCV